MSDERDPFEGCREDGGSMRGKSIVELERRRRVRWNLPRPPQVEWSSAEPEGSPEERLAHMINTMRVIESRAVKPGTVMLMNPRDPNFEPFQPRFHFDFSE